MKLQIYCAMCGKDKTIDIDPPRAAIDADHVIRASGWITQQNGEHFDIYCSMKCAA